MTWVVRLRSVVKRDVREARAWYEKQRPGLADEFQAALDETFVLLERQPLSFQEIYFRMRRVMMPRFPYGVFYIVKGQEVIVAAVVHGKRSPKIWQRRL